MLTGASETVNPQPGVVVVQCGRTGLDGKRCRTPLFKVWLTDPPTVQTTGWDWTRKGHKKGAWHSGTFMREGYVVTDSRWTVHHRCYQRHEPVVTESTLLSAAEVARESRSHRLWLADLLER